MRVIQLSAIFIAFLLPCTALAQTVPVANEDYFIPIVNKETFPVVDTTFYFDVLENDIAPGGEEIKIYDLKNWEGQEYLSIEIVNDELSVHLGTGVLHEHIIEYRCCLADDTTKVSNWAKVIINPGLDPSYPVARNDTIVVLRNYTDTLNVLLNDYHPNQDTLSIHSSSFNNNGTSVFINYGAYSNHETRKGFYFLSDSSAWFTRYDIGLVHVIALNNEHYDSLDINNINARFNCHSNLFWNMDSENHFKVPNGGNISSIFSQSFWIGGIGENNDLHVAAERYRANGADFYHGPVSDVYDTTYDKRWLHIWKLNREEIEYHKKNWWQPGYEPIHDILTWPSNGDIERGQLPQIAPFEDKNNNGIYEPLQGDAPKIKGDQALFYVFNDTRDIHYASEGVPLGIEVHAMAYGFDMPEDSALWNTIFLHYDIINRSDTAYDDVYLALFTDTALGYAWDDYVQSDVTNGLFFTYNGVEDDYSPFGYGEHPPAQGVQILGGPLMDADGIDNPKFDNLGNQIINESINGLNFGDGVADNERLGMTNFMYFNSGGSYYWNDPNSDIEYYIRMKSHWSDNSQAIYGGNGHLVSGGVGPDCNYMFPGDSDPLNWGTGGIWPNGGYNQNDLFWTEEEIGNNPNDRRGMISVGPFKLEPGQSQPLDIAFPWARDYEGTAWESALLLKESAAYIKELFQDDPQFFSSVKEVYSQNIHQLEVFPNPASEYISLKIKGEKLNGQLLVYNSQGNKVFSDDIRQSSKYKLNVSNWQKGVYLIRVVSAKQSFQSTFIKF